MPDTEDRVTESGVITVHRTADVSSLAKLGSGTKVWHNAQIREYAELGSNCTVGSGVYIGPGVVIGNNVKIQNGAMIYDGVSLEDGVFVGPGVCFTNDRVPRAVNSDGTLKGPNDWDLVVTHVAYGASIGAASVIIAGANIGRFALVAAGAVVTRDVPDHGLVMGVPARLVGYVDSEGHRIHGNISVNGIAQNRRV